MKSADLILIPSKTVVSAKGDGSAVDVSGATERVFLVVLEITKIIEQEALELSVYGSGDGVYWGPKTIVNVPQKIYFEEKTLLLRLNKHPDVRIVRAHWDVEPRGRGAETPR